MCRSSRAAERGRPFAVFWYPSWAFFFLALFPSPHAFILYDRGWRAGGLSVICWPQWPLWQVLLDFEIPPHLLLFLLGLPGPVRPPVYTRAHSHTHARRLLRLGTDLTGTRDRFHLDMALLLLLYGILKVRGQGGQRPRTLHTYTHRRRQSSLELLGDLRFLIGCCRGMLTCSYLLVHIYTYMMKRARYLVACRNDVHEYQWLFTLPLSLSLCVCFFYLAHRCSCRRLSSLGLATVTLATCIAGRC